MNLSVPTVTKLVSELIEEGFVHDFGKQGHCRRAPAQHLRIEPLCRLFRRCRHQEGHHHSGDHQFQGAGRRHARLRAVRHGKFGAGARPVMRRGQRVHRQEQDRPCQDFFGRLQPLGAGQFQDRVQLQLFLRRGGAAHDAAGETPGLQGLCRERYPGDDLRGVHVWRG